MVLFSLQRKISPKLLLLLLHPSITTSQRSATNSKIKKINFQWWQCAVANEYFAHKIENLKRAKIELTNQMVCNATCSMWFWFLQIFSLTTYRNYVDCIEASSIHPYHTSRRHCWTQSVEKPINCVYVCKNLENRIIDDPMETVSFNLTM